MRTLTVVNAFWGGVSDKRLGDFVRKSSRFRCRGVRYRDVFGRLVRGNSSGMARWGKMDGVRGCRALM